ncbi:MAG: hypothetical protein JW932_06670, partial [Deltaproteobacteria bacterium]|nr:hypothetical protein [Deltaproteobacteria bacterium]
GVQSPCNYLKRLDSGLRRNDKGMYFWTFYETINIYARTFLNVHHPYWAPVKVGRAISLQQSARI